MGDLIAKNEVWFDQDNATTEGIIINDLTTQHVLTHIIHEPIHSVDCSYSSIDLIFASVTNSGEDSSLHSNWHHQIIFSNLKIYYLPLYEHIVWEYDKANKDVITKAIDPLDWDKKLSQRCTKDQVSLFNETRLNIMSNFISNKKMIFDDRELPWFDKKIKKIDKTQKSNLQRHPIVKAIIIFSFTSDLFKISLTQKSLNLKGYVEK